MSKNLYCDSKNLGNEADVESFFISRLLADLGYADENIKPKKSLTELVISRGSEKRGLLYRPDYAIKVNEKIRFIIEAKAPDEKLESFVWQPRSYCVLINGAYESDNPVKYYVLTNGLRTLVYRWDYNTPILELSFADFYKTNADYIQFKGLLSLKTHLKSTKPPVNSQSRKFDIYKPTISEVNTAFSWCHQRIYKKDNISQAEAFTEFVKIISLKLLSDREIRDKYPELTAENKISVKEEDVKFSSRWLEAQSINSNNPLSEIQFRNFSQKIELEIGTGKRKRFFQKGELINLKPETIKGVVEKLEHMFLYGIDADLNGRLFETFLNATMRGKDLGQFFTPRSLVKLGVILAQLKVHVKQKDNTFHTDTVIDACCGTGGFLIDVFSEMTRRIKSLSGLSKKDQNSLIDDVRTKNIVGIDIGRGPNLSRIARLNMYLHGDGGTRIFNLDALDKNPNLISCSDPESANELKEYLEILKEKDKYFDVAITNPPFAKDYERKLAEEAKILDSYEIGKDSDGNERQKIKSSLLFIERYYSLLKEGGLLVSVIDDGILSGKDYAWFRCYIRSHFIVRAVISLPGDAFQRSLARVKTSFIVLEKKKSIEEQDQPSIFMYACKYIGNDDPSRQRELPSDLTTRKLAAKELETISKLYASFLSGTCSEEYVVEASRINDRMDVKYCLPKKGRKAKQWADSGLKVLSLDDLLEEKVYSCANTIITKDNDSTYKLLVVRYNGETENSEDIIGLNSSYSKLYPVESDDLVISNIAASFGSVGVVENDQDGSVVSCEYTVLKAKKPYNVRIIKELLRTPEIRSEILLRSTGSNRTRMKWKDIKDINVVYPDPVTETLMLKSINRVRLIKDELAKINSEAGAILGTRYDMNSQAAIDILTAFKPPD